MYSYSGIRSIERSLILWEIVVRRVLPWPHSNFFFNLYANQGENISLTVTSPCKVRTVVVEHR